MQAALEEMGPTEATRALRHAYQFIKDTYLDEPKLDVLGKAGLRSLATLDPALSLRDDGKIVTLFLNGRPIHSFEPPPSNRPDAWANTVKRAVESARAESPLLAQESWGRHVDVVLYGGADALDPYSFYESFNNLVEMAEALEGKPAAVAISFVKPHDPMMQVAQIRAASKADESGLQAGDVVEEINGEPVKHLSLKQLQLNLAGPLDTSVSLTVRDAESQERKTVTVAREEFDFEEPVATRMGSLLYLQLGLITDKTTEKVREAIEADLAQASGGATGIILDLRGASGSQPWLARGLMEFFVSEVSVFTSRGRTPMSGDWYPSWKKPDLPETPLVVLQNGATRTSAEAVAAAIADLGRGVVVGTVTLGQGRVPKSTFLPNAGLLSVSWSDTYSWSKYRISERGVLPMICTADDKPLAQLLETLKQGDGIIAWPQRTRKIDFYHHSALRSHRTLCPPRFASPDQEVELAKAILSDPVLYRDLITLGQEGKPPATN